MKNFIESKVDSWATNSADDEIRDINLRIRYLANRLYYDYEPTNGPFPDFLARLEKWLQNVGDDDQEALFKLVKEIFYIGNEEFNSLYRAAYNGPIIQWIIEQCGILLDEADLENKLQQAIRNTWFCPISDSLRINAFYHLNNIPAEHDERPDWRSLAKLAKKAEIEGHISRESIERLVLVEDFVGSGTQMGKAVTFAADLSVNIPVLVVPLVICPKGLKAAERLGRQYTNVSVSPIIKVPSNSFITRNPMPKESKLFTKIRDIINAQFPKTTDGAPADHSVKPYGPFGYKETGGLLRSR